MSGQGKAAQASYSAGGLVFLTGPIGPETPAHASSARKLVICVWQGLPAECAFQQMP
jgi:hypothetical protein